MVKEKNLTGGNYLKQLFFLQKCSHVIKAKWVLVWYGAKNLSKRVNLPIQSTPCLTHRRDCWLPLWSHWEEFPALHWGVDVFGAVFCCRRTSVERELWAWLPAMKANTLFSDQQFLFVKSSPFSCQVFLMLPRSVRNLGLYKLGTILRLSFIVENVLF